MFSVVLSLRKEATGLVDGSKYISCNERYYAHQEWVITQWTDDAAEPHFIFN